MNRVTLYVKDSDRGMWADARRFAGGSEISLSEMVSKGLRQVMASAARSGRDTIPRVVSVSIGPKDNRRELVLSEDDLSPETIAGLVGDAKRLLEGLQSAATSAQQILGGER